MDGNTTMIDEVTGGITTTLTPFKEQLTIANISKVLAIVISACLALYLFYWGVRKGLGMLQRTFFSGKLRF